MFQIFRSAVQMRNFVYLIGDSKTREVLVVDGAWDVDVSERTAQHGHVGRCIFILGSFNTELASVWEGSSSEVALTICAMMPWM